MVSFSICSTGAIPNVLPGAALVLEVNPEVEVSLVVLDLEVALGLHLEVEVALESLEVVLEVVLDLEVVLGLHLEDDIEVLLQVDVAI